eukprot:UN29218
MKSLKYTSVFSLVSIFILACVLGYHSLDSWGEKREIYYKDGQKSKAVHDFKGDWQIWPTGFSDLIGVAPIFCVAYVCHFNVLPVHSELRRPTRNRIRFMIHATMSLCVTLYMAIAFLGYSWSYDMTCDNILLNFPNDDIPTTIGRIALGVTLMLTYPLLVLPCRATFHNLIALLFPDYFGGAVDEGSRKVSVSMQNKPVPPKKRQMNPDAFLTRSVSLYGSPLRQDSVDVIASHSEKDESDRLESRRSSVDDWRTELIPATADPEP